MAKVRKVKCAITGEYGYSDSFYCVEDGKKKKYYKSEEIYLQHIYYQTQKQLLTNYMLYDIMNYDSNQQASTIMKKKLKTLGESYSWAIIFQTCKRLEETLKYWSNRTDKFKNEYQRVSYLFAIIQNNINDTQEEKNIAETIDNAKKAEIIIEDLNYIEHNISINKVKNISNFLEDDEL